MEIVEKNLGGFVEGMRWVGFGGGGGMERGGGRWRRGGRGKGLKVRHR